MFIANRAHINTIRSTFQQLQTKPPKQVADALERIDLLEKRVVNISASTSDLAESVTDALLRGVEPSSDPAVQQAVTANWLSTLHHLPEVITAGGQRALRDALTANLDKIIEQWNSAIGNAGNALTDLHATLGDVDLADAAAILRLGGDAADRWSQARSVVARIAAAADGWSTLMLFVGTSPNPIHRALRLAPLTLEQFDSLPAAVDAWGLIRAGVEGVSLPTLDEYRDRIASVEAERERPAMTLDARRSSIAGHPIMVRVRA